MEGGGVGADSHGGWVGIACGLTVGAGGDQARLWSVLCRAWSPPAPTLPGSRSQLGGGFRAGECVAGLGGRLLLGGRAAARCVRRAISLSQAGLGGGSCEHSAPVAVSMLRLCGGLLRTGRLGWICRGEVADQPAGSDAMGATRTSTRRCPF